MNYYQRILYLPLPQYNYLSLIERGAVPRKALYTICETSPPHTRESCDIFAQTTSDRMFSLCPVPETALVYYRILLLLLFYFRLRRMRLTDDRLCRYPLAINVSVCRSGWDSAQWCPKIIHSTFGDACRSQAHGRVQHRSGPGDAGRKMRQVLTPRMPLDSRLLLRVDKLCRTSWTSDAGDTWRTYEDTSRVTPRQKRQTSTVMNWSKAKRWKYPANVWLRHSLKFSPMAIRTYGLGSESLEGPEAVNWSGCNRIPKLWNFRERV